MTLTWQYKHVCSSRLVSGSREDVLTTIFQIVFENLSMNWDAILSFVYGFMITGFVSALRSDRTCVFSCIRVHIWVHNVWIVCPCFLARWCGRDSKRKVRSLAVLPSARRARDWCRHHRPSSHATVRAPPRACHTTLIFWRCLFAVTMVFGIICATAPHLICVGKWPRGKPAHRRVVAAFKDFPEIVNRHTLHPFQMFVYSRNSVCSNAENSLHGQVTASGDIDRAALRELVFSDK